MTEKTTFLLTFLLHYIVSIGLFVGLNAWSIAAQDSGYVQSPVMFLEYLQFALLQPLAYWLLAVFEVRWWQWSGLLALAAMLIPNSLAAALVIRSAIRLASRLARAE